MADFVSGQRHLGLSAQINMWTQKLLREGSMDSLRDELRGKKRERMRE